MFPGRHLDMMVSLFEVRPGEVAKPPCPAAHIHTQCRQWVNRFV
jgi:hypothetical protein